MGNNSGDSDSSVADAVSFSGAPASKVAMTMVDTTWRMFVPSVGLTLVGVWLDGQFDTKPGLMLGGIVLGFASAALLVYLQLRSIKRQEVRK